MAYLEDELGDIIAKASYGLGISDDKLSAMTGISIEDIQLIENYKLMPDRTAIETLADSLHLSFDRLIDIQAEKWHPEPEFSSDEKMILDTVPVTFGNYIENCYIFGCRSTLNGAIVDPGGNTGEILEKLINYNLKLQYIFITHGHRDHTSGLRQLIEAHPDVKIICNDAECAALPDQKQLIQVQPKEVLSIGNLQVEAISTPGHTPGSTCYLVHGFCFIGDTLFAGSIGRPQSSQVYGKMLETIRLQILSLPDEIILLPGHGPATTVAEEIVHNPFF